MNKICTQLNQNKVTRVFHDANLLLYYYGNLAHTYTVTVDFVGRFPRQITKCSSFQDLGVMGILKIVKESTRIDVQIDKKAGV